MFAIKGFLFVLLFSLTVADKCDTDLHPTLGVKGECMEMSECTSTGGSYLHNWCMSEKSTVKCCFHKKEEEEEIIDYKCDFPSFENPCVGVSKGYFSHEDPTKYVFCLNGKQVVLTCPIGENGLRKEWNDDKKVCEEDEKISEDELETFYKWLTESFDEDKCDNEAHPQFGFGECVEESKCNGVFVSGRCGSSTNKCCYKDISWDSVCNLGGQLYPHPIPTKFIHCAHGWPFVKDCPVGQRWVSERQWCDFI